MEVNLDKKPLLDIIENMPGGLCVFNITDYYPYSEVTVWNRFMEDATGYSKEEINAIGLAHICRIGHIQDSIISFLYSFKKAAGEKEIPIEITDNMGSTKMFTYRTSIIEDGEKKEHIIMVITEITDTMYPREEIARIKESEITLRTLVENTIDMVAILNPNLTIKYLNPSHEEILGYCAETFLNLKLIDWDHLDCKNKLLVDINSLAWAHPEDKNKIKAFVSNLAIIKGTAKCQFRVICKDGSIRHMETYGKAIYDGEILQYYVLSTRDVTEWVKAEEELKRISKRFMTLFNNVSDAIYVNKLDENGIPSRYVEVNDVACKRLGYSRKELTSMTIYDTTPELTVAKVSRLIDILSTKGNVIHEASPRTKDGRVIPVEMNSIFLNLNDEKYVLSISRDISERKEKEKAAEYERLRTEFFANISHELRTPVNVIFSALQLINSNIHNLTKTENLNKKYMPVMKQNCYRLIRLINNLIDVTKIDAGYFQLSLSNVDIVALVENITMSIAEYIENKGISLIFDTEVEEKIIACDADKIERIILNLISNAVKFTEAGGSIIVKIIERERNVIISVKDTGIGISKENQKFIFNRFIQVDKSFARRNEGSGIGLSLVKSLVELHNGEIRVKSELKKGSEFIITLPSSLSDNSITNFSNNNYRIQDNVEKINIEFSDIYF